MFNVVNVFCFVVVVITLFYLYFYFILYICEVGAYVSHAHGCSGPRKFGIEWTQVNDTLCEERVNQLKVEVEGHAVVAGWHDGAVGLLFRRRGDIGILCFASDSNEVFFPYIAFLIPHGTCHSMAKSGFSIPWMRSPLVDPG